MMIVELLTYQYIDEHIEEILFLEMSIFERSKELYDKAPWQRVQFASKRKNKEGLSCLVRNQHELVGFSICYEFAVQCAHISRFAIGPDYSAKGLGSKLLQFQLRLLDAQKYSYCSVDLVRKNTQAISLYERNGFKILKEEELHHYIMLKGRDHSEYLGATSTHTAMVLQL